MAETIFHGGCIGCLTQAKIGVLGCKKCQYFEANWELPDLSTRNKTEADKIKESIDAFYASKIYKICKFLRLIRI